MNDDMNGPEELDDDFFENLLPEDDKLKKDLNKGDKEKKKVKLNFDDATSQYANFCTLATRRGEVFLSFGKAFPPVRELKIDTQVGMSLSNAAQLHKALTKLLKQHGQLPDEDGSE